MIAVLQRVSSASVTVDDQVTGEIGRGFLILLGICKGDNEQDAIFLVDKISGFRVFPDDNRHMNLSIKDVAGAALVVSQFTLCADWRKGRRPSFIKAAPPEEANRLYEFFVSRLIESGVPSETGEFSAMMMVRLVNEGPVTFVLDSREK